MKRFFLWKCRENAHYALLKSFYLLKIFCRTKCLQSIKLWWIALNNLITYLNYWKNRVKVPDMKINMIFNFLFKTSDLSQVILTKQRSEQWNKCFMIFNQLVNVGLTCSYSSKQMWKCKCYFLVYFDTVSKKKQFLMSKPIW